MEVFSKHKLGPVTAYKMQCGWRRRPMVTAYCFLVEGLLVDTGCRHMGSKLLGALQGELVRRVLLTHHHEDHSGNAAAIKKEWGVSVYGHAQTQRKMANGYKILPYQHWLFGSSAPVALEPLPPVIEVGGLRFKPIHTPGHSKDHTVYLEPEQGWLFCGDLYVGSRIKYFRADEDFGQTLESLRIVADLDFESLYCAHNPQMKQGRQRIREKLAYLEEFGEMVRHFRDHKGMSLAAVTKHLSHREDRFVRWFTFGNVSFAHLVRSAWQSLPTV